MSKKRPGVQAAVRLAAITDISVWERVEAQQRQVTSSIKNLDDLNAMCEGLGSKLKQKKGKSSCISKEQLLEVVIEWKFAVGKPRRALMKYLHSNSDDDVQKCSTNAIIKAQAIPSDEKDKLDDDHIKEAVEELTELKGVGPATASAILRLIRPDAFCYMYDEVYLKINKRCWDIANKMSGWNTARVARALWVAARICAAGEEDHTLSVSPTKRETDTPAKARDTRNSKRRKQS
jgi:DNA uptake protein ComE-like DNA-binding protein